MIFENQSKNLFLHSMFFSLQVNQNHESFEPIGDNVYKRDLRFTISIVSNVSVSVGRSTGVGVGARVSTLRSSPERSQMPDTCSQSHTH